jgi:hypothetical protein
MVDQKHVDAKKDDLESTVEASVQESQGEDRTYGEPGGEPVFLDRPGGPEAKKVSLKAGHVADGEIWEEVFQNNAKKPTHLLRYRAGDVVPEDYEATLHHYTMYDSGVGNPGRS